MLFGWIRLLISFGRRRGRKDFYWPTLVLLFLSISCDFFLFESIWGRLNYDYD